MKAPVIVLLAFSLSGCAVMAGANFQHLINEINKPSPEEAKRMFLEDVRKKEAEKQAAIICETFGSTLICRKPGVPTYDF